MATTLSTVRLAGQQLLSSRYLHLSHAPVAHFTWTVSGSPACLFYSHISYITTRMYDVMDIVILTWLGLKSARLKELTLILCYVSREGQMSEEEWHRLYGKCSGNEIYHIVLGFFYLKTLSESFRPIAYAPYVSRRESFLW